MKIVSIGDALLNPDSMKHAVVKFGRYDQSVTCYFGPDNLSDMRVYIKKMETVGFNCEPVPEEILREIVDADVLQVHMIPVPAQVFAVAKKLKIVASNRGGTENIDIASATARGIPVICNPAHNANAVAEMTIGMMIAETRNIARCHTSMTVQKKWLEKFPNSQRIHEIKGSLIGIIGFGTIGRELARKLVQGFGARVVVADPFCSPEDVAAMGATLVSLDELLMSADIISILARVNDATKGMIGRREFALMKPTAVFINTARPALVDTDALCDALANRQIMGAAIDVYDFEPVRADNRLLGLDNVTLTCHKSGDTVEAFDNSPEMVLTEVERYFQNEIPRFLTNPSVLK